MDPARYHLQVVFTLILPERQVGFPRSGLIFNEPD